VAAEVYLEAMTYRDSLLAGSWYIKRKRALWRRIKYYTVRVVGGYFHKLFVLSSYKDIIEA